MSSVQVVLLLCRLFCGFGRFRSKPVSRPQGPAGLRAGLPSSSRGPRGAAGQLGLFDAQLKGLFPRRTNTPRFKGVLPDLASSHQALARARLQENRSLALQGLRDRQALRAQRRR